MQITLRCARLLVVVAALSGGAISAVNAASAEPVLVEVWCGSDDGLTLRLRDTLEGAFKSSPDFALSNGGKPGTLVVTIPTNVRWKQIGKQTQVYYAVKFSSADNRKIGTSTGSCWDGDLQKCAARIVRNARAAVRKTR